jgi:hypothetical protein
VLAKASIKLLFYCVLTPKDEIGKAPEAAHRKKSVDGEVVTPISAVQKTMMALKTAGTEEEQFTVIMKHYEGCPLAHHGKALA